MTARILCRHSRKRLGNLLASISTSGALAFLHAVPASAGNSRALPALPKHCEYLRLRNDSAVVAQCVGDRRGPTELIIAATDGSLKRVKPKDIGAGPYFLSGAPDSGEILLDSMGGSAAKQCPGGEPCSFLVRERGKIRPIPLVRVSVSRDGKLACGAKARAPESGVIWDLQTNASRPLPPALPARFSCARINNAGAFVGRVAHEGSEPGPAIIDRLGELVAPPVSGEVVTLFAPAINQRGDILQISAHEGSSTSSSVTLFLRAENGALTQIHSGQRDNDPVVSFSSPLLLNDRRTVAGELNHWSSTGQPVEFVWRAGGGLKRLSELFPALTAKDLEIVDLNDHDELLVCGKSRLRCVVLELPTPAE